MKITEAARQLRPGTSWNLRGDVLEQAADGAPRVTIPTPDELAAVLAGTNYQDLRRPEYPQLTDQLDAIMKGGQALTDMQALCMAVKAKYPKP